MIEEPEDLMLIDHFNKKGVWFATYRLLETEYGNNNRCTSVYCRPEGNYRCIDLKGHSGEHYFYTKVENEF